MKQASQITGKAIQSTLRKVIDQLSPSTQSINAISTNIQKIASQYQAIRNVDVELIPMQANMVKNKLYSVFFNKKVMKKLIGVVTLCGVGCAIYKYFYNKHCNNQEKPNDKKQQQKDKQVGQGQEVINRQQLDEISSLSTIAFQDQYEDLKCPITNTLMVEPVHLKCGHDFSKEAITKHIQKYHNCPLKCPESEGARIQDLGHSKGLGKTIERFKKRVLKKGQQWVKQRIQIDFEVQIN